MADQRITQLTALPKAGVAATDVLPIADISASQTKKVTAKDLVDAGLDLIDLGSIDINKLDQASATKLGTTALADDAVTAAKLANDSSTAVQTTAPASDNFEGRGYYNSTSGNLQVFNGTAYQQVIMPTAGIGDLQVTTGKLADGAVTTAKVTALGSAAYADSSVTTAKLADGAVTAVKIATDSITATQVAPNAIGASELADNAVDTASIVNLAVTEAKLGDGSVTVNKLGNLAVTDTKIAATTISYGKLNLADGSVPGAKIATDSITATQIAVAGVGTSELADASVTTAKLADGAVSAAKIAADSITAAQIAPSAVGASELADNAVDTASIVNLAVTEAKLGAGAVVEAKLGDLAVTNAKIANTTIAYGKLNLADGSIPGAKIATDSIVAGQLAANAVGTSEIADAAVTTAKLANNAVTAGKIAVDTITATEIAAGAIGTSELGSDAVTYDKIQNVTATDKLLGRVSAGAGNVEEINCTAAGRALLDDADAATQRATLGLGTIATGNGTWTDGSSFSGTSSGTNTGDQTITLTGSVTGTGTGTFATAITDGAITENAIATNAVTTSKLLDDAVTAAKLADSSAAIVAAASPSGTGAFIGQQWFNTNTSQEFTWTGSAWLQQAGIGTINIVDSTPIAIAVSYPDAYSATLTATLDTQTAATVFAGPTTGADTAPTFRAIVPGDLPDATAGTKGIVQPGTGLAATAGVLNHTNAVTGATVSSITFDNQGHITAAVPLVAGDIPALDASKITTGELPTARYADASITATKIADYANAQIGETLPVADHIGQFFFNPIEGSVFLWDGNVWQPVGVTTGAITFAGTFNAASPSGIGQVATVTAAGSAAGLVAGSALPAASATNSEYYLVVSNGGTITSGNAPLATLAPPDLVLSNGATWVEVDVSTGAGAIAASNVSFTAGGDISAVNVQTAIAEVSSECRNADNITSGTLAVARGGTGVASYSKGNILAASASTTLNALAVGTNGQVLRANSATATGLEWGADFAGTVTTVSSATAALTVATATTTPALTLRSATTSVNGIVQLSDSTSTTSSVLAATPTAVKSAYDLAALALPAAGGTVTGDITLGTNVGIQFEGTTNDANEIRLIGADATADRTITLPNATGTVALTSQLDDLVNVTGDLMTGALGLIAGTASAPGAYFSGDTNTGIYSPGADTLAFAEGGVEAMRIDSSGKLLIGATTARTNFGSADISAAFQIEGTDYSSTGLSVTANGTVDAAAVINLARSRGTAVGSNTIVEISDTLGVVDFEGSDGTRFLAAARVECQIDGTPGPGSMPGRLRLCTTPSGSGVTLERMRIRSDGNIGIGGAGSSSVTLLNQKGITGFTTAYGNFTQAAIQSDVTTSAYGNRTSITTAATAFTVGALYHYSAAIGTLGAGSAITNNIGFFAEGVLGTTSAAQVTNVYGFRGDIASATGRWNFYAAGTAPNYFAGDVRTNTVVTKRQASTNSNTTGTVATAASLIDGIRTSTPTADITLLVPTGTSMDAAFQELQANQSFEWSLLNFATAASGFDVTVTANTDHTISGNMVVTGETSGRFLTRKTAANTFITYRIA